MTNLSRCERLPPGVEASQISGPFFLGPNRLDDLLDQFRVPPRVFILRMRLVPMIDGSVRAALKALLERCHCRSIVLIVSGLQRQRRRVISQMHVRAREGELHFVDNFDSALELARELIRAEPTAAQG